jgi:hypothetical protein
VIFHSGCFWGSTGWFNAIQERAMSWSNSNHHDNGVYSHKRCILIRHQAFHIYIRHRRAKLQRMDKSVQLRREKASARVLLRHRLVKGELRPDQVSIAAALPRSSPRPLILTKVMVPDPESG